MPLHAGATSAGEAYNSCGYVQSRLQSPCSSDVLALRGGEVEREWGSPLERGGGRGDV